MQLKIRCVAASAWRKDDVPGSPEIQAVLESPAWTRSRGRTERPATGGGECGFVVDVRAPPVSALLIGTVQPVTEPEPTNRPTATTPLRIGPVPHFCLRLTIGPPRPVDLHGS